MAVFKINLKKMMQDHVRPVAANVQGCLYFYDGLMGLIGGALDKDISFDLPDPPSAPAPGPGSLPANPIDPTKALGDIAKAIKEAETTLLGENLAIHNASVDIDLVVNVGGVPGASAKFNLQIGPVATD